MNNMRITEVIKESCIDLSLRGTTKNEIIEEIAELFHRAGILSSKERFIKDVTLREEEGPTGIGDGVAIPHGKSDAVLSTSMAVGRAQTDIEWESFDDAPVRVFVMFAVKPDDKSQLVALLAQVAVALCDEKVIGKLFTSNNAQEIIQLFSQERGEER